MKLVLILSAVCIASPLAVSAQSDSGCEQVFVLSDKTKGDHALMFYREDWQGDKCGRGKFYTLFILPDRVHSFPSDLRGNWVSRLLGNMPLEEYVLLSDSAGLWRIDDSVTFRLGRPDASFEERYAALPRQDARTWYWECAENCHDTLVFEGACPERIYRHPGGLYKDYGIKEARYYPESRFLIVVTDQPRRDEKGRSMHGLIIFNVNGWQWLDSSPCDW
jgi:hypothetical protein